MDEPLIREVLVEQAVFETQLQAATARDALRTMIGGILARRGVGDDRVERLVNELLARERFASNAQDNGIAIPHLYWGDDPDSANCVGWFYSPDGVPYGAPNGELTHWFFCSLLRDQSCLPVIGTASQLLASSEFREAMATAANSEALGNVVERFLTKMQSTPRQPVPDATASLRDSVVITHLMGLHARPCASVAMKAMEFTSQIYLTNRNGLSVDAKRILDVMSLTVMTDDVLEVHAAGPDAREALSTMIELLGSDFGLD